MSCVSQCSISLLATSLTAFVRHLFLRFCAWYKLEIADMLKMKQQVGCFHSEGKDMLRDVP